MSEASIPLRANGRRRDRRGRGLRGPLIPAALPAASSRREDFDELVARITNSLCARLRRPPNRLQVAVEDVPPADPAPWEMRQAPMSRYFPSDPAARSPHRVVVYRRVVELREDDVVETLYQLLAFHIGTISGVDPEDLLG